MGYPIDERPARAPAWAVLSACCAVVLIAFASGATWLTNPVLGAPAGLWLVGLAFAFVQLRRHRPRDAWPADPLARVFVETLTRASATTARLFCGCAAWLDSRGPLQGRLSRLEDALCRAHDRLPWPERPLRIAIDLPPDEAQPIVEAEGVVPIEWMRVAHASCDAQDAWALCARHCLDAVVLRTPRGGAQIVTARAIGREATLADWTFEGPITFGSLFPFAIDPGLVSIEPGDNPPELVRGVIEAVAWLARSPFRLTLADRCFGRRPIGPREVASRPSIRRLTDDDEVGARIFGRLAQRCGARGLHPGPAGVVAAKAAGAWIAADPLQRDARFTKWLEHLAIALPDDPAPHLRLASARFAGADDEGALEALRHALITLVRTPHVASLGSHAAFVEAELMHGLDDAATLGRVAAGLCLICAATPADRLPFLKEDLLEETRYADWLMGRDAEARTLHMIFRELERTRRELEPELVGEPTLRVSAEPEPRDGRIAA